MKTVLTVLATIVVVAPATALATNSFSDVATSDFFHDAVDWMADNDVTAGCNPPSNTRYCPNDPVTRGQMAVFMERLDTNDVFLRPGDKASDADKLDGLNSTAFLRSNGKASDAERVDGFDSSQLRSAVTIESGSSENSSQISGNGEAARLRITAPTSGTVVLRHTSTWSASGEDFSREVWMEPRQPGNECDSASGPAVVPGTYGHAAVYDGFFSAWGIVAGQGHDSVTGGSTDYSLCVNGGGTNRSWSASIEWYPAGSITTD